jgi:hypothetical protein
MYSLYSSAISTNLPGACPGVEFQELVTVLYKVLCG